EYSTIPTGDSSGLSGWWAVYRWATIDDGYIDRHSRISPPARFSWPRRARLKVSAPNLPMGADGIAPSLAQKTSTPSITESHSPAWWYEQPAPSSSCRSLPADADTAPAASDANTSPNGDPSVLEAGSGLF